MALDNMGQYASLAAQAREHALAAYSCPGQRAAILRALQWP